MWYISFKVKFLSGSKPKSSGLLLSACFFTFDRAKVASRFTNEWIIQIETFAGMSFDQTITLLASHLTNWHKEVLKNHNLLYSRPPSSSRTPRAVVHLAYQPYELAGWSVGSIPPEFV